MKVKGNKSKNHTFFFLFHIAFLFFQALESQLSRLTRGLSQDMKKARELLNLADESIPVQICRDLAAARLELETSFDAASQTCAERSRALVQALGTERVRGGEIHTATLWNQFVTFLTSIYLIFF